MCFVAINLKGWLFLCRKAFSYCLPPFTVMSFFFYREKNISILLLSSIFYTFPLFPCGFFLFPSHQIICPGLPIQIRILLRPQSFLSPPREVPLVTRWMKWNAHSFRDKPDKRWHACNGISVLSAVQPFSFRMHPNGLFAWLHCGT